MSETIGKVLLETRYDTGGDRYGGGDEAENRIMELVSRYQEREYPRVITENPSWPILYNLSPLRENILNWVPFRKGQKVLELGAGCGAVTGAFLRRGLEVTCTEPSARKCRINATRHEDCAELRIYTGTIGEILPHIKEKYDHVTLIGGLAEAAVYSDAEAPFHELLKSILPVLKEDGILWVAAENKMGMKYFAGCREDHTAAYYEGICGYPHGGKERTFSRKELVTMAEESGYSCSLYYPYPDFRFPVKIFSDEYLPHKGELSRNWQSFDMDRLKLFDESRAFDSALEAGLFPEMTNAFLAELRKKVEA